MTISFLYLSLSSYNYQVLYQLTEMEMLIVLLKFVTYLCMLAGGVFLDPISLLPRLHKLDMVLINLYGIITPSYNTKHYPPTVNTLYTYSHARPLIVNTLMSMHLHSPKSTFCH